MWGHTSEVISEIFIKNLVFEVHFYMFVSDFFIYFLYFKKWPHLVFSFQISDISHILYGILGVYSYYSIFFIHKNIWNMICYMHFVVYIKYYSLYILFIFIFIFLFFARANIQTIICHRSYVYIFGFIWFIYIISHSLHLWCYILIYQFWVRWERLCISFSLCIWIIWLYLI